MAAPPPEESGSVAPRPANYKKKEPSGKSQDPPETALFPFLRKMQFRFAKPLQFAPRSTGVYRFPHNG